MPFNNFRFRITLYLAVIGLLVVGFHIIFDVDIFEKFVALIHRYEAYEVDELVIVFPLILIGLIIDGLNEKNRKEHEIELQRLKALKSTMTTVHDISNNFLNNMQYFIMEARENKQLKDESIETINTLIFDTAEELKLLGQVNHTKEQEYSAGISGIDYKQKKDKPE